jgi:integrase
MASGQLFRRTYKATDGTVRTVTTWTIRWYRNGRAHEEATRFTRKGDAQRLLNLRNGDLAHGKPITAAQFRLTFDDAAKTVLDDFKANGRRSLVVVQRRITKHLAPFFGGRRLADISGDHILAYIAQRKADTRVVYAAHDVVWKDGTVRHVPGRTRDIAAVSNAEINRELQVLKRCFSLALKHGKIFTKPHIPKLAEAAPRAGFFDRDQVQAVCRHLPAPLDGLVMFGFITGWRLADEVQTLQWYQVDMQAGEVRLHPGTTKNGEGRVFRFTEALRTVLETRRQAADLAQRDGTVVPWVFFRLVAKGRRGPKSPKPIKRFTKAWRNACAAAGLPGRIPHDLRRSAVRRFIRAGNSESVSMALSGHKTASVFKRYNITSDADMTEASAKLDALDRDSSVTVGPKRAGRASRLKRIS